MQHDSKFPTSAQRFDGELRHGPSPGAAAVLADLRADAAAQRQLLETIRHSPRVVAQRAALDVLRDGRHPARLPSPAAPAAVEGLPGRLVAGIASLSGLTLDGVRVHRNSPRPAALDAQAYTRGSDIHLAPGQEQHLAHEAWHVVQQAQGRVRPTTSLAGGVAVNDDPALEHEADLMGSRAARISVHAAGPSPSADTAAPSGAAVQAMAVVQRVRATIVPPPDPVALTDLEQAIAAYDREIDQLDGEAEDVKNGFLSEQKVERIRTWRAQYTQNLDALRRLSPGATAYPKDRIADATSGVEAAFKAVMVSLANIRGTLNASLNEYTRWKSEKEAPDPNAYQQEKFEDKHELRREQKKLEAKAKAAQRKPGLGSKWGQYSAKLKRKNQLSFHQHVPDGADTIAASLKSGSIVDAVFHTDKAFWVADPAQFKLGSADGKSLMIYTFSAAGARSLMEDYLICGSGDFHDDNDEAFVGETAHPYHTIWKTNEVGAYGIGAERLKELAPQVAKIEAFDSMGKKISGK